MTESDLSNAVWYVSRRFERTYVHGFFNFDDLFDQVNFLAGKLWTNDNHMEWVRGRPNPFSAFVHRLSLDLMSIKWRERARKYPPPLDGAYSIDGGKAAGGVNSWRKSKEGKEIEDPRRTGQATLEDREEVKFLLSHLDETPRYILQEYYFSGTSRKDIADALGTSEAMVTVKLGEALKEMKRMLSRMGAGWTQGQADEENEA